MRARAHSRVNLISNQRGLWTLPGVKEEKHTHTHTHVPRHASELNQLTSIEALRLRRAGGRQVVRLLVVRQSVNARSRPLKS